MYNPPVFAKDDLEQLHGLIRANPFGLLVTATPSGLKADHLPFELDLEPPPFGVLRGHVSLANPVWRDVAANQDALIVFSGPNAYVSPSWYPSKRETAQVVPTWNYIAVHARGPLKFHDDRQKLRAHLDRLTEAFERGRPEPWSLAEAPDAYVERQMKMVVAFEMPIRDLTGKWKMSQNRPLADHAGVVEGLAREPSHAARDVGGHVEAALRARTLEG